MFVLKFVVYKYVFIVKVKYGENVEETSLLSKLMAYCRLKILLEIIVEVELHPHGIVPIFLKMN